MTFWWRSILFLKYIFSLILFTLHCFWWCVRMHVHTCMQVPKTTRTGSQIPWDWSYSQLWAAWSEYWESNSGPWKPASVLIAEWCLQPSRHFLRPSLVPLVGWEGALLPVKSQCLKEVCHHYHHFPTRWIAENQSFAETIPSTRPPDWKLLEPWTVHNNFSYCTSGLETQTTHLYFRTLKRTAGEKCVLRPSWFILGHC